MSSTPFLIPVKKFARRPGTFRFPAKAVLASGRSCDRLPLKQLAGDLKKLGVAARVERSVFGPAAVRIRRDKTFAGCEACRITISRGGVEIAACGDAGAYYAVQTLRELLTAHGRSLPAGVIEDAPDFPRRGIYHDCSRGKVPRLETLKGLVEQLGRWKINELQLYVENVFAFARHPAIGRGYSPFTPDELLELQDHCRLHHVRLVGSLASFGHLEKVLALPEYRHLGEMAVRKSDRPGSTLCPTDPGAIRLMAELYEEFLPIFEADDFNICGDETWELGRGRSKRRADRVGVGRLYLEFILKVHELCLRHGKRMNMWGDIVLQHPELLGELPKDIVMLNWDYHPQGKRIPRTNEFTDAGLPLVVCPGTNSWGSHGCRLEMGMKNIAAFTAEGKKRGAEGVLNTDWGDGGHRNMLAVSLHNFAYGAAHSWNHAGVEDRGFTERFCRHTFGGAPAGLAKAIRTLGSAHRALGIAYANSTPMYYMLLVRPEHAAGGRIADTLEQTDAKGLAAHAKALSGLRWPPPAKAPNRFLAGAFEEYDVAARLDAAACRWMIILKELAEGRQPAAARLRRYAAEARSLASRLQRVWLRRNKPSRLRDILRGLRHNIRQCRRRAAK